MNGRKRSGWIFDGGGFLSVYGVGFAKACWEAGLRPNYIQAVSGGLFNGAKICECRDVRQLEENWLAVDRGEAGRVFDIRLRPLAARLLRKENSLFSSKGVDYLIRNYLDFKKINKSPLEMEVAITNESKDCRSEFFNNRQLTPEIAHAAIALMGFLPPVKIKDSYCSDGMFFSVRRALRKRCQVIFLFLNDSPINGHTSPANQSAITRVKRCIHVANNHKVLEELYSLLRERRDLFLLPHPFLPPPIKELQMATRNRQRQERALVCFAPQTLIESLQLVSFKSGDLREAISHGYEIGKKIIQQLPNQFF